MPSQTKLRQTFKYIIVVRFVNAAKRRGKKDLPMSQTQNVKSKSNQG